MLGFTKNESIAITVLSIFLVVGSLFNFYNSKRQDNYISEQSKIQLDTFAEELVQKKKEMREQRKKEKYSGLTIDINLASAKEFEKLPNIGPVLAKRIVEFRTENGKFNSTDELILVKGIGKKKLSKIQRHLKLEN
jgi:competence protein ComEA